MYGQRTTTATIIPSSPSPEARDIVAVAGAGATVLLGAVFAALYTWQERATTRRRLLSLDDRMLSDVGLTRADAEREGLKPFWQA